MSRPPDIDRPLSAFLEDEMSVRAPEHLVSDVLAAIAKTRRRPAWRIPERWFPMTLTLRLAVVPRPVVLLLLLTLAISLVLGGAIIAGSLRAVSPAPLSGTAQNGLIAYSDLGDIWLMDERGEQRQQLTSGPDLDLLGRWSPDGSQLAYWSISGFTGDPTNIALVEAAGYDDDAALKVVRPGDTTPHTLVEGISLSRSGGTSIAWSPDGSEIAYAHSSVDDPTTTSQIDIISVDGGASRPLVANGVTPSWSPDGRTIAYVNTAYFTDPDGNPTSRTGISVIPAAGGEPGPLSRVRGDDSSFLEPQWSSDGQRILFHAGSGFLDDIYVAEADGSGEVPITSNTDTERFPRWSPDNERIVFYRAGPSDGSRFVTTAPDGTEELVFDHTRTGYRYPHWSPDGTKLLGITAEASGAWSGLVVFDANDATPPLTFDIDHLDNFGDPTWQPLMP